MQVILLEKVINLGQLGDVVKVRQGYARNFLIPQGKARRATDAAIKEFETRRADLEKAQSDRLAAAQAVHDKLSWIERQDCGESGSRRPFVRLGHELRHCRSPRQARIRCQQGADSHAARTAEGGWRASRLGGLAYRRRGGGLQSPSSLNRASVGSRSTLATDSTSAVFNFAVVKSDTAASRGRLI